MITLDLEKLYEVIPWPMRPGDPKAKERFARTVELFNFLLANHSFFKLLSFKGLIKVLDVMAGSGIAGAALARSLVMRNLKVSLTVSDIRSSDLKLVHEWLEGVEGVDVEALAAEASELCEVLPDRAEYYDVALLWGLSTPHLYPWQMAKTYSSICHLLSDSGVLAIDETDRIFNIFYKVGFKSFLTEGELGDGRSLVSVHAGYDERRGMFKRNFYTLPGFNWVTAQQLRFWDLAGIAALGWLFFKDIDLIPPSVHRIQGLPHVILLTEPRRRILPEELRISPTLLRA